MEIAAIIPTHGNERKLFTDWQVKRAVEIGFDKIYLIDYTPISKDFDLFNRIAVGVNKSIADGYEFVSIVEDDDFYPLNYLEIIKPLLESNDIVGINQTTYYHLFSTGWKTMVHPGRSSMFCTSFRTDLFSKLPTHGTPYHDLSIWKFARDHNDVRFRLTDKEIVLGIKHGNVFGAVGGNGHSMVYPYHDVQLTYLKSRVDNEAFRFYKSIKSNFQSSWERANTKR